MKISNLIPGVRYIVTSGSDCGTINGGDKISVTPLGAIDIYNNGPGTIDPRDALGVGVFEAQLDMEFLKMKIESLELELQKLKSLADSDAGFTRQFGRELSVGSKLLITMSSLPPSFPGRKTYEREGVVVSLGEKIIIHYDVGGLGVHRTYPVNIDEIAKLFQEGTIRFADN